MPIDGAMLRAIYEDALAECDPARLVASAVERGDLDVRRLVDLVCVGKATTKLAPALEEALSVDRVLAVIPDGYGSIASNASRHVLYSSHPQLTNASFIAGDAVLDFVSSARRPIVFAISGGASASIEKPRAPFDQDDLISVNGALVRAGLDIDSINTVRKHISAIKGGGLAKALPEGSITVVLSDVDPSRPEVVGSGPTVPDRTMKQEAIAILERLRDESCARVASILRNELPSEHGNKSPTRPSDDETPRVVVVGDNRSLVAAASLAAERRGLKTLVLDRQLSAPVNIVAADLIERISALEPGMLVIAGGEPTVEIRGDGRGGRCFELAAHVALHCEDRFEIVALFGSSDGVDGNSGAAGALLDSARWRNTGNFTAMLRSALERSDTFHVAQLLGEAIIVPPTGNNLRDIFLLARR